jgi:F0F1-type ATP synthase assembly protein I
MVIQVALIIGGLMIGSVFLGLFVDARLDTRPLFTLVLSFVSLPISVWLTYRLAMKTVSKARATYEAYLHSKGTAEAPQGTGSRVEPLAQALDPDH